LPHVKRKKKEKGSVMKIDKISRLLQANDLTSKLDLVKAFKNQLDIGTSHELRPALTEYVIKNDAKQRISNFDMVRLYGPGSGLPRYVANQLLLFLNIKTVEDKITVLEQLETTLTNMYESRNPLLKITKARLVIDLLQNFLGDHFQKLTHKRFLSIYFVPYESNINNAAFDINTNSIVVFRTKEKDTQTPEYIFLHEFGHLLHSTIFQTIKEVPKSFVEFNEKMNPTFSNYSKEDQLEIYADFFSIAVMLDSDFEDHNPFIKTMQRVHLDAIKEYFIKDLSSLN
jgi:hypothetical protein